MFTEEKTEEKTVQRTEQVKKIFERKRKELVDRIFEEKDDLQTIIRHLTNELNENTIFGICVDLILSLINFYQYHP